MLLFAGMVAGCAVQKRDITPQPTTSGNTSSLEFLIDVQPFSKFDPTNVGKFVNLRDPMTRYVFDGLDVEEQVSPEAITIKRYIAFENQIYSVAQELGYSVEQVRNMTPKEALVLTTKVVAHRMNYFGRNNSHEGKQYQEDQRRKLKIIFNLLQVHPESTAEEKQQAIEGMKLLDEIGEKQKEIKSLEKTVNDLAGLATYRVGFDTYISPSELFMEQQPIVCRQYATITRDVFFVLKQKNPRLANTHVSVYKERNHVWNQATTVYEDKGRLCIDITFFDSTWYDTMGIMEGKDDAHFGNYLMLTSQVQKFTKAVADAIQLQKQEKVTARKN